ncbi:MAG: DUF4168 domain-containing protein [Sphingomonas sp.]
MTRFGTLAALMAASTLAGTAAIAQNAPAATANTTASAAAPTASAASYTDADVNEFATAAIAVQKIQGDASVAATDKQKQMASAVTSSGLTPEKFNAIATASQSDPALMKRIQTAASAKMEASAPSPKPSAGSVAGSASSTGN